jgi:hypothetical protein
MMLSAASWPSAVVFWPPVIPAGQTSSAALDLGQTHDRDALRVGRGGVDGVVEDAGGSLRPVNGRRGERLVFAARGDLAEDRAGLEVLAGEDGDGLARDLPVTLGDDDSPAYRPSVSTGIDASYRTFWLRAA